MPTYEYECRKCGHRFERFQLMSAPPLSTCPQCKAIAERQYVEAKTKADKAYGKVKPAEYQKMLADLPDPGKLSETLREDYELGIMDGGTFYVRYFARCDSCGFNFKFVKDESLPINPKATRKEI